MVGTLEAGFVVEEFGFVSTVGLLVTGSFWVVGFEVVRALFFTGKDGVLMDCDEPDCVVGCFMVVEPLAVVVGVGETAGTGVDGAPVLTVIYPPPLPPPPEDAQPPPPPPPLLENWFPLDT